MDEYQVTEPIRTVADFPTLSVIIPARNAAATIPATLDSIFFQEYQGEIEVIVADGSDTSTMAGVIRRSYPKVHIVPNPEGNTPSGLNHAIRESVGKVIVRCDAHAVLPPGYVQRVVETLRRTGAANVGGMQCPIGVTLFERAVAVAMTSKLGAGNAVYRLGGAAGPTDTVYLGAWYRDTLESVGGFNTHLIRNQDYELNWRLREQGGTIWFDPGLAVNYRPRGNVLSLACQYFGYGRWKSVMLAQNPASLRVRQLVAPLLVLGLVTSVALAAFKPSWLAAVLPFVYLVTLVLGAMIAGLRRREPAAVLLPVVLATMHVSWGIGFFLPARQPRR